MSKLAKILGHDEAVDPYDADAEYDDGTCDRFSFWARDVDDALSKTQQWMPKRDGKLLKIKQLTIRRRLT